MITAIVVDDEPKAIDVIKIHASKIEYLNLVEYFHEPQKAISFLKQNPVDLIFLDINMPEISGMEILQKLNVKPYVIFTTAYSEFALESYEYDAVDYLLKPIEFERFQISINKIQYRISLHRSNESYFFIKDGFKNVKIKFDEILFIKGCGNYLRIATIDKMHLPRMTFYDIFEKLPPVEFVRIHNSYIVNIANIDKIENNHVHIKKHKLPISNKFRNALLKKLNLES